MKILVPLAVLAALAAAAVGGFVKGRRLATEGSSPSVGLWRPIGAVPTARVESAILAIGPEIYFFGGFYNFELQATTRADVYNTETGEWRRLADLPVNVTHIYAVHVPESNEVWFAGGFDGDHPGTVTDRVLIYSLDQDAWSEGPPLPEARAAGGFAKLGSRLHYVSGLKNRLEAAGDHWVLDLNGERRWEPLASLPDPRSQTPMLALDGELFVVGGQFGHDQPVRMDRTEVHAYDPETDTWRSCAPLPRPLSHHEYSTTLFQNKIVTFGGRSLYPRTRSERPALSSDTAVNSVFAYDKAADEWTQLPALPIGLMGASVATVGDQVYVAAGSTYLTGNAQLTVYRGAPF